RVLVRLRRGNRSRRRHDHRAVLHQSARCSCSIDNTEGPVMTSALEHSPGRACSVSHVPRFDMEADVIVVGFGAAGACATIEAARTGARVLLFEVAAGAGGTSALSGGEIYLGGS